MIAPGVAFEDINETHVTALIDNGVAERRTIEYKRDQPGGSDSDRREFLADVSSFANASGGDLLYGVEEKDGTPIRIVPLTGSPDQLKLALESSVQNAIEPRIPGIRVREIAVDGGHVLLFRIPRSWLGPHAVTFKGSFRFYSRNSAGKYPLDVGELRGAFLGANELAERMRNFRTERLAKIIAGDTPEPLRDEPKIVVHVIASDAFSGRADINLNATEGSGLFRPLFSDSASGTRWNLDGRLAYGFRENGIASSYAQLFRNGIFEGVNARKIGTDRTPEGDMPFLYGQWIEIPLNTDFQNTLEVLKQIGVQPPLTVLVTVLGVRGYVMLAGQNSFPTGEVIDRDVLLLPEIVIDDFPVAGTDELARVMRPAVDALWQAGGWPGSRHYQPDGGWKSPL